MVTGVMVIIKAMRMKREGDYLCCFCVYVLEYACNGILKY